MEELWRRTAALAGSAGIMAMLLAGCGRKEPQIVETQRPEETSITVMASQNWVKDIDKQLFQEFEEETGIDVKLLLTPDNRYEFFVGECMAGGSDAVDIFMFPAGSGYSGTGMQDIAVDLSEEKWVKDLEEWALEACSFDGKVIGFSTWGEDYEGILYNKTFLRRIIWRCLTPGTGFLPCVTGFASWGRSHSMRESTVRGIREAGWTA